MNPEESGVSKEVNETPFIAGNFSISEKYRLAALSLAFFAPQHDPRQWLTGWYPKTLQMKKTAVQAVNPADFSRAGTGANARFLARAAGFFAERRRLARTFHLAGRAAAMKAVTGSVSASLRQSAT